MRAILIDPFTETISEVEYDGIYRSIYRLLSHPEQPVDTFTVVRISAEDTIFVDDNGLLNEPTHFFEYYGYPQPLAGKGLILGVDDEGESIATMLDVDYVRAMVTWKNDLQLVGMDTFEDTIDHPLLGPKTKRFGSRPVFTKKS